jgi:hypothetical protein
VPRVLLVGYDPETVDFTDPALPPGMNAEKIRAGLVLAIQQMTERGWECDLCLIPTIAPRRRWSVSWLPGTMAAL